MNTLSSLLEFLGNALGEKLANLNTTSKTLVGAINELKGNLGEVDTEINALKRRKVECASVDSMLITIEGNATGTFAKTYTVPRSLIGNTPTPYLTGMNLRATGTNYNRVFIYGGALTKTGSDALGDHYDLTCYGRNTGNANATDIGVRFRILLITDDEE